MAATAVETSGVESIHLSIGIVTEWNWSSTHSQGYNYNNKDNLRKSAILQKTESYLWILVCCCEPYDKPGWVVFWM